MTAHVVAHPTDVQTVLQDPQHVFTKNTRGYQKLRSFLGDGLVTSDGEFWRRQRRIAQPAFSRQRILDFTPTMVRAAEDLCAKWERDAARGEAIDVSQDMNRVTLRIAGETLLSTDPSDQASDIARAIDVVLHEAVARINSPLGVPESWPTPRNVRFRRAAEDLDRIVLATISARRSGAERSDDLAQMLVEARDPETGEGMSDRQLRDEIMTMFLAGHETTANALTWTLTLLSRFPSIARALHEEAVEVLGDRSACAEDLPRLDLARRVFLESMRLYPPVWVVGRSPSVDVELGGFDIPQGSLVFVCQWITHRHPDFWENPEGFDPDRWLPERAKSLHRYQYFPFALGPRMCIGAGFAQQEAQLLLATFVRRFRLDLVPGHPVVPEPLVTLRPKHGVLMHVHRR